MHLQQHFSRLYMGHLSVRVDRQELDKVSFEVELKRKFMSFSHCQELCQHARWLLIGCTRMNNQSEVRTASWHNSWQWLQLINFHPWRMAALLAVEGEVTSDMKVSNSNCSTCSRNRIWNGLCIIYNYVSIRVSNHICETVWIDIQNTKSLI